MLKQIEGSRTVAEAVAMCCPQVICAYLHRRGTAQRPVGRDLSINPSIWIDVSLSRGALAT
jgi:hypothetical protein